ncbi:abortive infection family protein [Legionella pneumophila]|uniref:abortive infection family protein n=1 Tax=Legionella pneumophila TaxID=446 RepID=UPI000A5D2BC0|nr:abortive infection family protein [Legionella pneumophila]
MTDDADFNVVAQQVRDVIQKNQPEAGLDRLHTFFNKFIRIICEPYGIEIINKTKALRPAGCIEPEMTERILKSSISIIESFNYVRNDKSLAHDNPILNYEESILIFNHISAVVRFIKSIEHKVKIKQRELINEDLPF